MRQTSWTAERKLVTSLTILATVLVLAVIAQLAGFPRLESPHAASSSETPATEPPRERAVFGVEPHPSPESTRTRAGAEDSASTPAEIDRFLEQWASTVLSSDLDTHTSLYAPKMDRFFRQRNVAQAAVRREKARMMRTYPKVKKYDISDVTVESHTGNEAVVSFRKEWEMSGRRRFAGAERERIKLRRIAGDWKIVSEEETKVYWMKRG